MKNLYYSTDQARRLGTVAVFRDPEGREIRCTEARDPGHVHDSLIGPPRGRLVGVGVEWLREEVVDHGVVARRRDLALRLTAHGGQDPDVVETFLALADATDPTIRPEESIRPGIGTRSWAWLRGLARRLLRHEEVH